MQQQMSVKFTSNCVLKLYTCDNKGWFDFLECKHFCAGDVTSFTVLGCVPEDEESLIVRFPSGGIAFCVRKEWFQTNGN